MGSMGIGCVVVGYGYMGVIRVCVWVVWVLGVWWLGMGIWV